MVVPSPLSPWGGGTGGGYNSPVVMVGTEVTGDEADDKVVVPPVHSAPEEGELRRGGGGGVHVTYL